MLRHPDAHVELRLTFAKDAAERRAIRRKARRVHRAVRVQEKLKLKLGQSAKYCSVPLLGGRSTIRCSACHNVCDPHTPCPCWEEGIQETMTFQPKTLVATITQWYWDWGGPDEPIDILKPYIDAAVSQLAQNMAYNFGKSIAAMVALTADPVADPAASPVASPVVSPSPVSGIDPSSISI